MTATHATPTSSRRGFTLTEVLFVTALTSLIIAMGIPTLVASIRLFEATAADIELATVAAAARKVTLSGRRHRNR